MESHFGQAPFFMSARFKLMTWLKNSLSSGKPHVLVLSGWRANRRRPASLCSTRTSRLVFTTSLSNCSRRILLHTSHRCAIFSPPSEAISTPCPRRRFRSLSSLPATCAAPIIPAMPSNPIGLACLRTYREAVWTTSSLRQTLVYDNKE